MVTHIRVRLPPLSRAPLTCPRLRAPCRGCFLDLTPNSQNTQKRTWCQSARRIDVMIFALQGSSWKFLWNEYLLLTGGFAEDIRDHKRHSAPSGRQSDTEILIVLHNWVYLFHEVWKRNATLLLCALQFIISISFLRMTSIRSLVS